MLLIILLEPELPLPPPPPLPPTVKLSTGNPSSRHASTKAKCATLASFDGSPDEAQALTVQGRLTGGDRSTRLDKTVDALVQLPAV